MNKYEEIKKQLEVAEKLIKINEIMKDRNYWLVKENNIFLSDMKREGYVVLISQTQCHWSNVGSELYKDFFC